MMIFRDIIKQLQEGEVETLDLEDIDLKTLVEVDGGLVPRLQMLLSVLQQRDNRDIKELFVSDCNLDHTTTTQLALIVRALPAVEEIMLEKMDIAAVCSPGNTAFLEALRAANSLTRLIILESKLTAEIAGLLFTYVQLPRITELVLSDNPLGDAGLHAVFSQRPERLETLELSNCELTAKSMPILRLLLSEFPLCTDLLLDGNPLQDLGVLELLNGPNGLRSLCVSECGVTDYGAIIIGEALNRGFLPHLITLMLMRNQISATGLLTSDGRGLIPGIIVQKKLRDLRLDSNNLSDLATPSISFLIQANSAVEAIGLMATNLTDAGVAVLERALHDKRLAIEHTVRSEFPHVGGGTFALVPGATAVLANVDNIYLDENPGITSATIGRLKAAFPDMFFLAADAVSDEESEYSDEMQDVTDALDGLGLNAPPAPPPSPR